MLNIIVAKYVFMNILFSFNFVTVEIVKIMTNANATILAIINFISVLPINNPVKLLTVHSSIYIGIRYVPIPDNIPR